MSASPSRTCTSCGRTITWRKKWAADWDSVRYCSQACRRAKVNDTDRRLEQTILALLSQRPAGATIDPDEAARAVAGEGEWAHLRQPARSAARRLTAAGQVEIIKNGHVVDPSHARGPVRIRRTRNPAAQ